MPLTQQECTAAIAEHSPGFADVASGNLEEPEKAGCETGVEVFRSGGRVLDSGRPRYAPP